jgi:hypothetical protein
MWEISGQKFEFRFVDILAAEKFISPTLELKFSRSSKINGNQPSQDLIITNMNMQLYVKQDEYNIKILDLQFLRYYNKRGKLMITQIQNFSCN